MRTINNIVLHCTAGSQKQTARQIVDYHTRSRAAGGLGWKAPGYHYIVEPDGTVVNTWPEEAVANGVAGHNGNSLHVSYIGGIGANGRGVDNRTEAQKRAIVKLLKELRGRYPEARILGHRDLASRDANGNGVIDPWERVKECPCFDAIPEYAGI
ncbi:MAG: N-acetylmuramoyl-L-alanine amidase [Muribaculaceae bacterium]|nr:N-acetylmuramoyl-L-alanine amidase [Muribaculaceae bacterium]